MQPQATALVNAAYFDSLTAQVNAIDLCGELQAAVNEIMADLQVQVSAIELQVSLLLPLITLPTDLGSVITWITNFATPLLKPYLAYAQQLEQTLAAIASLASAIEAAAGRLEHCSINIPPVSISVQLGVTTG